MADPLQRKKFAGLRSRFPNMLHGSPFQSPQSASTASLTSQSPRPSTNEYTAIGGIPTTPPGMLTPGQRMKEWGGTAYRGLIEIVQALSDCSDIFLPLKTACNVILAIHKTVDKVSTNREQLKELEVKLAAILTIVEKYQQHGGMDALHHRIKAFCQAVTLQADTVKHLQNRPVGLRIAEGTEDAGKIAKVFRTMSILCDVFQMDTQLNIDKTLKETDETVKVILQRLKSGVIERLRHETTSYKTRLSSYGDPHGCLAGTRVKILADLEAWALDGDGRKVYWLVGMAGTGKSTISHTLCEILDHGSLLGASFFCSRASTKTNDARLIIPTIAHALASASPSIKSKVIEAIEEDEMLPESTYVKLEVQFNKLVRDPLRASIAPDVKTYKVIVIDAVDECTNLNIVSSLIKLVLQSVHHIPLKIFIASRDEAPIRSAFDFMSSIRQRFILHEVEKDVVEGDIRKYIETSLSEINSPARDHAQDAWPSPSELSELVSQCGKLFIYAATAIRYIKECPGFYEDRLSSLTNGSESKTFQASLDDLYGRILDQACMLMERQEIIVMRNPTSLIVFLQNPLPIKAITSLSGTGKTAHRLLDCLSRLKSVIHVPDHEEAAVTLFHASFFDFVTDPARCTPERCHSFHALVASEGHHQLALKCLVHMNDSLKYNICDTPNTMTVSRQATTNSPDNISKISEALKYSCLHWTAHLAGIMLPGTEIGTALHHFLRTHLLHWIECLSVLGELETGINSLRIASTSLSRFKTTDVQYHDLQLLVDDASRWLQLNFEAIQKHCMEVYQSSLVWIPKKSLIREVYAAYVSRAATVTLGLPNTWGPMELAMQNGSRVYSVAFSQDSSRVVSGSDDNTVRIWNATTGEMEAELKGHTDWVRSVAFSQDSSCVVSGSHDKTVRIWNATTGEMEAELKGHTHFVRSIAFSQDSSRVVSGSHDKNIRIWNATTGEMEAELKGHTDSVTSVMFSQDSSRIVSGSNDKTVRIWNAMTGEMEAELKGHTGLVNSVAFIQDRSRVVSGSDDNTVRIWNATTGEVEVELKGHTHWVTSVAFAQDSSRVVSASYDKTVRIWNAMTGEMEAELKGHTDSVMSVAFSQDSSRVVSGSHDNTVQIWNATTGEMEARLKGHTDWVMSVTFSQDSSRVASGSYDNTVRIWNAMTGKMEAELKGHTDSVWSVAFSQDGSRVISGSYDNTVRIWNVTTGEMEAELKSHTNLVTSIAFCIDGSRVPGLFEGRGQITNLPTDKSQPPLLLDSISLARNWISGTHSDCWIPVYYRNFLSCSFSDCKVCFGYQDGCVIILDMTVVL